ncbi:MAG: phospho-sugar mutase [Lachnospiraceae bacterium]|nr:phospho-sugar mutase [Lachnospiraceae bacterium]
MNYIEKYNEWINSPIFDADTKDELKNISDNKKEIEDRFYKDLEFGTGGLRGIIGAGTNRMNIYTVGKATQGLANYIIKEGKSSNGVAIAYDSRRMSPEFANVAAGVLNGNGIKTYIFDSLRPTPELSFAVRQLKCSAGIVITASHNPAEYNGYKVYWEDGAQITFPRDKEIIEEVNSIKDFSSVKKMNIGEAKADGLYNVIGEDIDNKYLEELLKQSIHPDIIKEMSDNITIVYTPLHGTGNLPVRRVLEKLGFRRVYVVKEQEVPDGNFPTVAYPNPEDEKAFELAIKLAKEVDADIVLATDPDADRLGVYAKDIKSGKYISFNGNMLGMIIAEYILREKKSLGILPKNGALVKTIVTTNMADAIAKDYGIKLIEVLTGFKYIGEQIKLFEENNSYEYIFGLEESYGCLAGTYARDKDACVAVMLLCEVAAWCKKNNMTLWDNMIRIYEKYGYFKEDLHSITIKGLDGVKRIQNIMENFRKNPPKEIGGARVLAIRDYNNGTRTDLVNNTTQELDLVKSNVLYYELSNDFWCAARPSGTEPKIKFYFGVKGKSLENASDLLENLKYDLLSNIE